MHSGASGVACFDPSFAVSATRARECRLHSAPSIIAPPVNVLRRTRPKPSTIRGAPPDVVIGQSTAGHAGARPISIYLIIALSAGGLEPWSPRSGQGRTPKKYLSKATVTSKGLSL